MCEELLRGPPLSPVRHPREHTGPHTLPGGSATLRQEGNDAHSLVQDKHFLKWPETDYCRLWGPCDPNGKTWLCCWNVKAGMDVTRMNVLRSNSTLLMNRQWACSHS